MELSEALKLEKSMIRDEGFTFLELMAVLALLGLLYFFALPSLTTNFEKKNTAFGSWIVANAAKFKTASKNGSTGLYIYLDLDSEAVWTGADSVINKGVARKLGDNTDINYVEFISGLKVTSGVARIGFFKGGYSDGVIIHTTEHGKKMSYRLDPFLDGVTITEGSQSWEG